MGRPSMSQTPAFGRAAEIEAVLALMAGALRRSHAARLRAPFATQPQMKAHFWRDGDDAVKGEMLSRTFAAILDFRGRAPLRPPHGSGTEMSDPRGIRRAPRGVRHLLRRHPGHRGRRCSPSAGRRSSNSPGPSCWPNWTAISSGRPGATWSSPASSSADERRLCRRGSAPLSLIFL